MTLAASLLYLLRQTDNKEANKRSREHCIAVVSHDTLILQRGEKKNLLALLRLWFPVLVVAHEIGAWRR